LNVKLVRKLDQTRGGGHDLELAKDQAGPIVDLVGELAFECKRYGLVTEGKIRGWWEQAVEQAGKAGLVPALAYREDRSNWRIILPLSYLFQHIEFHPEITYTMEMSIESFAVYLRAKASLA
jgi:hypothetical protein